jgi:hypothetical protein
VSCGGIVGLKAGIRGWLANASSCIWVFALPYCRVRGQAPCGHHCCNAAGGGRKKLKKKERQALLQQHGLALQVRCHASLELPFFEARCMVGGLIVGTQRGMCWLPWLLICRVR